MPQLTRKIDYVYYRRALRQAGETKYTFTKMLRLARQSIFAQTNALLLGIGLMIIIYAILSLTILGWILIALATGAAIPGWSSILITILITSTVTLGVQYMMAEHMTLMSRDIKNPGRWWKKRGPPLQMISSSPACPSSSGTRPPLRTRNGCSSSNPGCNIHSVG